MSRLCLLLAVWSASALADPVPTPTLTQAETKKLLAGEAVIREKRPVDGKGVAFESMAVIDAPSSEVWPILRDCAHFSKFMPKIKKSALKQEAGEALCAVELELPWPLTNLWSDTRSVQREEPAGHYHRAWKLVRGTYKRNDGSWTVLPWAKDPAKTLVVYAVDSDPKMLIPDPLIRGAQVGALPDVFKAIRKRVVDQRKLASQAPPAPSAPAQPAAGAPAQPAAGVTVQLAAGAPAPVAAAPASGEPADPAVPAAAPSAAAPAP